MLKSLSPIHQSSDRTLFWLFASLVITFCVASVLLYNPIPLLVPVGLLFTLYVAVRPRDLFYLFFALLPFSIEFQLGSFGTDLPSEPLMIAMLGMGMVYCLVHAPRIHSRLFLHPISLVIITQLAWIAFTAIYSTAPIVSLKFLIAKVWYVVPFYFLPLVLLTKEKDLRRLVYFLSGGLFIAMLYVLMRHAAFGFSFESSNKVLRPIFRNHVNYAIMLLAFLPYFAYLIMSGTRKFLFSKGVLLLILLSAIFFSYTRAAQASVFLALVFYFIMKFRAVKICIGIALIGLTFVVMHLTTENKYLDYAPNFEKTITHKKFDNLVEATTKMEDISTVERFYRWVAGGYMLKDKPLVGFGPATFYFQYRPYTVTSYKTYVSDNPEKSGIHNNYLMVAVEQGIPGLLIMLAMTFLPLIYGENLFHTLPDKKEKLLVCAATTCLFLISVAILINDLIEADKIGPLYFLSIAIIVIFSQQVVNYPPAKKC